MPKFSPADWFSAMVNESIRHENNAICKPERACVIVLTISKRKTKPVLLVMFFVLLNLKPKRRPDVFMACTLIDHRNDSIECSKLKWNH